MGFALKVSVMFVILVAVFGVDGRFVKSPDKRGEYENEKRILLCHEYNFGFCAPFAHICGRVPGYFACGASCSPRPGLVCCCGKGY
ncbi:Hypothetical predicted protein [Paramuricea clavata]|nr:Hypothetical predicted protein [Paramuricea clavata]